MIKIAFLILHYKNIDETLKCVESIISISENSDYQSSIVIVDNGSNDGTGEKLEKKYFENLNVKVIISKINLGFSRGNNLGYSYVRKHINPNYLVVTNNDIIFYQGNFVKKVDEIYNSTGFYVLGPDIYVRKNREHQSPIFIKKRTINEIEDELLMYKFYLDKPSLYVRRRALQNIKNKAYSNSNLFRRIYNKIFSKIDIDRKQKYENVGIQGACILVSKDYLDAEEKMFSPEPFLYCEELFLFFKCIKNNYKIVYDPSIQVWHEDSASFKFISKNSIEKAKITLPNHINAREMLLKYLKNIDM